MIAMNAVAVLWQLRNLRLDKPVAYENVMLLRRMQHALDRLRNSKETVNTCG